MCSLHPPLSLHLLSDLLFQLEWTQITEDIMKPKGTLREYTVSTCVIITYRETLDYTSANITAGGRSWNWFQCFSVSAPCFPLHLLWLRSSVPQQRHWYCFALGRQDLGLWLEKSHGQRNHVGSTVRSQSLLQLNNSLYNN